MGLAAGGGGGASPGWAPHRARLTRAATRRPPPTPSQPRTRKVLKSHTYLDESGYLVTEEQWVEEEIPEGEDAGGAAAAPAPASPAPAPKPKPAAPAPSAGGGKAASGKAAAKPPPKQQQSMLSFFGKK